MALDEVIITKAIIDRYYEKLIDNLVTDLAIVGGGPSGVVAGTIVICDFYCNKEGGAKDHQDGMKHFFCGSNMLAGT